MWLTDWAGEFVRATDVIIGRDTVSFVRATPTIDIIVATYKLKDIKDYHLVE